MAENKLPALPYPDMTPQNVVSKMPVIDGSAYEHVGRYAGAIVMAGFHQVGGMERFTQWIDDNYGDFATKLLPKIIQKSTAVNVSGTVTIDDAISRLESQPIEGQYRDVSDAFFEDTHNQKFDL